MVLCCFETLRTRKTLPSKVISKTIWPETESVNVEIGCSGRVNFSVALCNGFGIKSIADDCPQNLVFLKIKNCDLNNIPETTVRSSAMTKVNKLTVILLSWQSFRKRIIQRHRPRIFSNYFQCTWTFSSIIFKTTLYFYFSGVQFHKLGIFSQRLIRKLVNLLKYFKLAHPSWNVVLHTWNLDFC